MIQLQLIAKFLDRHDVRRWQLCSKELHGAPLFPTHTYEEIRAINFVHIMKYRPEVVVIRDPIDFAEYKCSLGSIKTLIVKNTATNVDRLTNLKTLIIDSNRVIHRLKSLNLTSIYTEASPRNLPLQINELPSTVTRFNTPTDINNHWSLFLDQGIQLEKIGQRDLPTGNFPSLECAHVVKCNHNHADFPPSLKILRFLTCNCLCIITLNLSNIKFLKADLDLSPADMKEFIQKSHKLDHIPDVKLRLKECDEIIPDHLLTKITSIFPPPQHLNRVVKMPNLDELRFGYRYLGDEYIWIVREKSQFEYWPKLDSIYISYGDDFDEIYTILSLLHNSSKPINNYPRYTTQEYTHHPGPKNIPRDKCYTIVAPHPDHRLIMNKYIIDNDMCTTFGFIDCDKFQK